MPLLFESRASGSVLMTDASASALLQALGRSESDGSVAPEGVFSVEQLPDLIAKLQALIDQSKKQQQQQQQQQLQNKQSQSGGKNLFTDVDQSDDLIKKMQTLNNKIRENITMSVMPM